MTGTKKGSPQLVTTSKTTLQMSDTFVTALIALAFCNGVVVGYILWAPETDFKRGFIDGLTFKFLRR